MNVDTARLIVELAAHSSVSTCCVLVRVSKQFHAWATPILYATVVLSFKSHVRAFHGALAHTPSLRPYVNALVIRYPASLPISLTHLCPALVSLYIDIDDFPTVLANSPTGLKHLTVCGPLAYWPSNSLAPSAAGHALTHLVFVGDIPRSAAAIPILFPILTHFSCHLRIQGPHAFQPDLRTAANTISILKSIFETLFTQSNLKTFILVVQDDAASATPSEQYIRKSLLASLSQYLADPRVHITVVPPNSIPTANLLAEWDLTHGKRWLAADTAQRQRHHRSVYPSL